ncbi:hypothetical protein [Succinispira mobilis]|uniref:hypothetical protein n=1 Tax=Succinispira mobilis TaxID=78120 RepID=UPI000366892D|nr:hypothetical protein [Succinispira mobilis]
MAKVDKISLVKTKKKKLAIIASKIEKPSRLALASSDGFLVSLNILCISLDLQIAAKDP